MDVAARLYNMELKYEAILCPLCPQQTAIKYSDVGAHVATAHTGYTPFRCRHCGGDFPSAESISNHTSTAHPSQSPAAELRRQPVHEAFHKTIVAAVLASERMEEERVLGLMNLRTENDERQSEPERNDAGPGNYDSDDDDDITIVEIRPSTIRAVIAQVSVTEPNECASCRHVFSNPFNLNRHLRGGCGNRKRVPKKEMQEPRETAERFQCPHCKRRFPTSKSKALHASRWCQANAAKYSITTGATATDVQCRTKSSVRADSSATDVQCTTCSRSFQNNRALWTHRYRSHGIIQRPRPAANLTTGRNPRAAAQRGLEFARKIAANSAIVDAILDSEEMTTKEEPEQTLNGILLKTERSYDTPPTSPKRVRFGSPHDDEHRHRLTWTCPHCLAKGCNRVYDEHRKICVRLRGNPCPECPRRFSDLLSLEEHKTKTGHGSPSKRKRIEPAKAKAEVPHHSESHSSNSSNLLSRCQYCQRTYLANMFQSHQRTCISKRAFPCGECQRRFRSDRKLARHQQEAHDEEEIV